MSPDRIERTTVIDAPVARVWTLLTEPAQLGAWFSDAGAELDLRAGGRLVLRWQEHGTAYGRVVDVEPERRFAFRWIAFPETGDAEPDERNSTLVTFTLEPDAQATRVTVVEEGFAALDASDELRATQVRDNTEGWEIQLGRLADRAQRQPA